MMKRFQKGIFEKWKLAEIVVFFAHALKAVEPAMPVR